MAISPLVTLIHSVEKSISQHVILGGQDAGLKTTEIKRKDISEVVYILYLVTLVVPNFCSAFPREHLLVE